jgi:hypothetical protein
MVGAEGSKMKHLHFGVAPAVLACTCILLTGCSSFATRTTTLVPVPVECKEAVPARPVMPTEQFTGIPPLDALLKAALAEIERREGYEVKLRAALVICTTPLQ